MRTQQSNFEFSVSDIMYELGGKTTYGAIEFLNGLFWK